MTGAARPSTRRRLELFRRSIKLTSAGWAMCGVALLVADAARPAPLGLGIAFAGLVVAVAGATFLAFRCVSSRGGVVAAVATFLLCSVWAAAALWDARRDPDPVLSTAVGQAVLLLVVGANLSVMGFGAAALRRPRSDRTG